MNCLVVFLLLVFAFQCLNNQLLSKSSFLLGALKRICSSHANHLRNSSLLSFSFLVRNVMSLVDVHLSC